MALMARSSDSSFGKAGFDAAVRNMINHMHTSTFRSIMLIFQGDALLPPEQPKFHIPALDLNQTNLL